jgi:DNA-directed RNA polymerase subunit RPC12/RpoP
MVPVCARCGAELQEGRGELYVVNIEAFADPTLVLTDEDLQRDVQAERQRLLEAVSTLSEQEAMDQVYRRLTAYLCSRCYFKWIERPFA